MKAAILGWMPLVVITEVGSANAPVRGVRVSSQAEVIRIDLLTGARVPGTVPSVLPAPVDEFQVDLSMASLLAIARTEAFRAGPMTHGIVCEPTVLDLTQDGFAIGIRLWKTTGNGWWHDYQVEGTWTLVDGNLELHPSEVKDLGHSRGAALADPLVALAEGIIQRSIGKALDTALPTRTGELGEMGAGILVDSIQAANGMMRVNGRVTVRGLVPATWGPRKRHLRTHGFETRFVASLVHATRPFFERPSQKDALRVVGTGRANPPSVRPDRTGGRHVPHRRLLAPRRLRQPARRAVGGRRVVRAVPVPVAVEAPEIAPSLVLPEQIPVPEPVPTVMFELRRGESLAHCRSSASW